ncbi:hypothetical protein ACQ5SO_17100 [Rhodovulum sp. DZ06]|uniref:hypothetical protein n=1 Tax=Rhodovulum sp. DZ06 TaxID=3425126 RepID=UPI003D351AC8
MTRTPQGPARRLPTADQARRVAERAEEILGDWTARGLPRLAAIEVGPVRLEFAGEGVDAPIGKEAKEAEAWRGRPFG